MYTFLVVLARRIARKLDPLSRLSADIGVIIAAVLSATPGDGANVCVFEMRRDESG